MLTPRVRHHGLRALNFDHVPESDVAIVGARDDQRQVGSDVDRGYWLGVREQFVD